jgi:hypothetical protein
LECSRPAVITENLIDLSARLLAITDRIKQLPRDMSSISEVKQHRAQMRKYFDMLETQRKQVKEAVLEPYTRAEAVYKDMVAEPFKKADKLCKAFVDEVESAEKKVCEDTLRAYFTELCHLKGIYWLRFEQLGIKVDMAMARQKEPKKAMEQIKAFVQNVDAAVQSITGMEDANEILSEYTKTLDLAKAISTVSARKEGQKQMEAVLAANRMAQEARKQNGAMMAAQMPEAVRVTRPEPVKLLRATFSVTATMPMLRGLKAFLDDHNYEYQEVTDNG